MTEKTVSVLLPEGVAREVERLAQEGGITPAQFLASAAAENVSAITSAAALFKQRGAHADWAAFERALGPNPARGGQPGFEDSVD